MTEKRPNPQGIGEPSFFVEKTDKKPGITPGIMLSDNRSEASTRVRRLWDETRRQGNLTAVWACGDARLVVPLKSAQVRSIAAGGSRESYERLFNDRGITNIVALAHHDGETVRRGKVPKGCGGLQAKEEQMTNGFQSDETGIAGFVREHVYHSDVLMQALLAAEEISQYTEKPVLAATQDHLTARIIPIAFFQQRALTQTIRTAVRLKEIADGHYRPDQIYAHGIPRLQRTEIFLEEFHTFFAENEDQVRKLAYRYPDLRDRQKVQNPGAVVISSSVRPLRSRYYDTFGDPGSGFEIRIARDPRSIDASVAITQAASAQAIAQAEYPLVHAMANRETDSEAFRDTDLVLIETGSIYDSRRIADELLETAYGREWLQLGNKVFIAEIRAGEVVENRIEDYKKAS